MKAMQRIVRYGMLSAVAGILVASLASAQPAQNTRGGSLGPSAAEAGEFGEIALTLNLAKVMRLDRPAGTIIVGNPGIADATLGDSRTIVLTGKAAGTTNMIAISETGDEIANVLVRVTATGGGVKVFNGLRPQTYSCAPACEPVIAVGDEEGFFQSILSQTNAWQGLSGTAGSGAR